jgi:hypothetical protein
MAGPQDKCSCLMVCRSKQQGLPTQSEWMKPNSYTVQIGCCWWQPGFAKATTHLQHLAQPLPWPPAPAAPPQQRPQPGQPPPCCPPQPLLWSCLAHRAGWRAQRPPQRPAAEAARSRCGMLGHWCRAVQQALQCHSSSGVTQMWPWHVASARMHQPGISSGAVYMPGLHHP